jgi:hypothetical protein
MNDRNLCTRQVFEGTSGIDNKNTQVCVEFVVIAYILVILRRVHLHMYLAGRIHRRGSTYPCF